MTQDISSKWHIISASSNTKPDLALFTVFILQKERKKALRKVLSVILQQDSNIISIMNPEIH
jgi:hypothetical protein